MMYKPASNTSKKRTCNAPVNLIKVRHLLTLSHRGLTLVRLWTIQFKQRERERERERERSRQKLKWREREVDKDREKTESTSQ